MIVGGIKELTIISLSCVFNKIQKINSIKNIKQSKTKELQNKKFFCFFIIIIGIFCYKRAACIENARNIALQIEAILM